MIQEEKQAFEYFVQTYGMDNIAISEDIKRAFIAGTNYQKNEFMKNAIQGKVCILGKFAYVKEKNLDELKQFLIDNFNNKENVKIIVIKDN